MNTSHSLTIAEISVKVENLEDLGKKNDEKIDTLTISVTEILTTMRNMTTFFKWMGSILTVLISSGFVSFIYLTIKNTV